MKSALECEFEFDFEFDFDFDLFPQFSSIPPPLTKYKKKFRV